jgi:hypothetical protein
MKALDMPELFGKELRHRPRAGRFDVTEQRTTAAAPARSTLSCLFSRLFSNATADWQDAHQLLRTLYHRVNGAAAQCRRLRE